MRDIFFFKHIEIFYKYILIGVIPFIHKYIKYSIKEIKDHYISILELKYDHVYMWDRAYSDPSIEWELTEENKYHKQDVPIKEYVEYEVKKKVYKNNVKYEATVIAKESIYEQYRTNNKIKGKLTENDHKIIDKEFYDYMSKIKLLTNFYEKYSMINNDVLIKIFKIIIFASYFICWAYVLFISVYCHPLTFEITLQILIKTSKFIYEPFSNMPLYEN